jgi:hypothetical protein
MWWARGSQNCAFAPVAMKERKRILVPPGYAVAFPHDLTSRPGFVITPWPSDYSEK